MYVRSICQLRNQMRVRSDIGKWIVIAIEPERIGPDFLQHASKTQGARRILRDPPLPEIALASLADCLVGLESERKLPLLVDSENWTFLAGF